MLIPFIHLRKSLLYFLERMPCAIHIIGLKEVFSNYHYPLSAQQYETRRVLLTSGHSRRREFFRKRGVAEYPNVPSQDIYGWFYLFIFTYFSINMYLAYRTLISPVSSTISKITVSMTFSQTCHWAEFPSRYTSLQISCYGSV